MIKKDRNHKSASTHSLEALCLEIAFTFIQRGVGKKNMSVIFNKAREKGFVKTSKQFRKWIVKECVHFMGSLNTWLDRQEKREKPVIEEEQNQN